MRIATLMLVLISLFGWAQDGDGPAAEEEAVDVFTVEKQAEFKGGYDALAKFISKNVEYPDSAMKYDIQGMVMVQFVVNKRGEVTDCRVVSKPFGYGLEEEAIRVVKLTSGKWIPGESKGRKVNVRYQLPINFQIY